LRQRKASWRRRQALGRWAAPAQGALRRERPVCAAAAALAPACHHCSRTPAYAELERIPMSPSHLGTPPTRPRVRQRLPRVLLCLARRSNGRRMDEKMLPHRHRLSSRVRSYDRA
jgi:hypothetical protein